MLEAGFDKVTPNVKLTISSWAYDKAETTNGIDVIDNRAIDITCYHPGYTSLKSCKQLLPSLGRNNPMELNGQI